MAIQARNEPVEYLIGIKPNEIEEQVAARSNLIRLRPELDSKAAEPTASTPIGRRHIIWDDVTLGGGLDVSPSIEQYLRAMERLGDEPEVALTCVPDLYHDIENDDEQKEILMSMIQWADESRDRLLVMDFPPSL